jgi:hypothetical protein
VKINSIDLFGLYHGFQIKVTFFWLKPKKDLIFLVQDLRYLKIGQKKDLICKNLYLKLNLQRFLSEDFKDDFFVVLLVSSKILLFHDYYSFVNSNSLYLSYS